VDSWIDTFSRWCLKASHQFTRGWSQILHSQVKSQTRTFSRWCQSVSHQPSRWWLSGKSLGPRGLLPLWSQVQALWLLIWWPLEAYMVVNFRARGISRGTRKLTRTPTLNLKKKCTHQFTRDWFWISHLFNIISDWHNFPVGILGFILSSWMIFNLLLLGTSLHYGALTSHYIARKATCYPLSENNHL